jgi:hypothetical protein
MGFQISLTPDQRVSIDVRGAGEWIVHAPEGGRSLHVYMLEGDDWLVSEVGRGNQGRGTDLPTALSELSGGATLPDWWDLAVSMLGTSGDLQA